MNAEQLRRMSDGRGFIAALDQSGGSTPKALELYGVKGGSWKTDEEMYELVHRMRTRVMTSPAFTREHILGVILFENTMLREVEGELTPDYLWKRKGIVPFLKVDRGLAEEGHGVRLMKPMPGLDGLLREAVRRGIFGTKMRSVIYGADAVGVEKVVRQQFEVAEEIIRAGLVPIIEPEVDISSKDKGESEELLKRELWRNLEKLDKGVRVMFKLSIPDEDGFYGDIMKDPRVVRVVALSGGYGRVEADERLARNPGMIASFSRALLEGLSAGQTDVEFNVELGRSIGEIAAASAT